MELNIVSIVIAALALLIAVLALVNKRKEVAAGTADQFNPAPLRLQAYERLVLLTERISLPNLISRLSQPDISALGMKIILTENIKQEFEFNSTQQLYVSQASWDALRNLKEQNIMVINRISDAMPPTATGLELNKKILETVMSQPQGALHETVLQTLNHEAKKLMK